LKKQATDRRNKKTNISLSAATIIPKDDAV